MKFTRLLSILLATLTVLMLVTGCSGAPEADTTEPPATSTKETSKLIHSAYDLTYKTVGDTKLGMDLLMPETSFDKPCPVIVFVHGGSWVSGSKSQIAETTQPVIDKARQSGYAVASVDYRLLDRNNHFPGNIEDVKDSVRFVRSLAKTYHLDSDRIGIMGTSAGGHLSLLTAYTDDKTFAGDSALQSYSARVKYVVDYYGPTRWDEYTDFDSLKQMADGDISRMTELVNLYGGNLLSGPVTEDSLKKVGQPILAGLGALLSDYSPLNYVSDNSVPTMIVHGTADTVVAPAQSDALNDLLNRHGVPHEYIQVLDSAHGLKPISEQKLAEISSRIWAFIQSNC